VLNFGKKPGSLKIRLTKQFHFEMAHVLYGNDGPCRNIHRHSCHLEVTVLGKPRQDASHTRNGMVIDFSELKRMVNTEIVSKADHALVLNASSPHGEIAGRETPTSYTEWYAGDNNEL
jgi:6-pyruvoyltetrahydropterin/6-carboxytetrahydropterin synthase